MNIFLVTRCAGNWPLLGFLGWFIESLKKSQINIYILKSLSPYKIDILIFLLMFMISLFQALPTSYTTFRRSEKSEFVAACSSIASNPHASRKESDVNHLNNLSRFVPVRQQGKGLSLTFIYSSPTDWWWFVIAGKYF